MNQPALLDDTDRELIAQLIRDGRSTYAKLAPTVGLSQAAVRTRVQRLLDEAVITVTGRVDPASFGLGVFAFALLEVAEGLDKAAAAVAEIDEAVFVVAAAGRFDLLVEVRCRDHDHLLDTLDRIRGVASIRRLQSASVLHYEKQDWTGIGDHTARPPAPRAEPSHQLDQVDRALLVELMADGRATYAALAPKVGLSQAAVRDRVIDLLDSRVITIQAHPAAEAMGIGGFAGIAVKATGPVTPLVEALTSLAESTLVVRCLGRFDLMAELWFDNHDHLADVLDQLRALPGMGTIDTVPYLRIAKEDFTIGKRS